MKIILFGAAIITIAATFGLRLILLMSYSSYDNFIREVDDMLLSKKSIVRIFGKLMQSFIANRFFVGLIGVFLLLASLLIK